MGGMCRVQLTESLLIRFRLGTDPLGRIQTASMCCVARMGSDLWGCAGQGLGAQAEAREAVLLAEVGVGSQTWLEEQQNLRWL